MQFDWTFPVTGNLRGDLQILHGYGDAHAKSIVTNIDRNTYLALVTRAGGETVVDVCLPEFPTKIRCGGSATTSRM